MRLVLVALIFVQLLPADWQQPATALDRRVDELTESFRFDLLTWEVQSISGKLGDVVRNPAAGLSARDARALVLEFTRFSQRVGELEDQIERIYSNPHEEDPRQASLSLQEELGSLQSQIAAMASAVEAILERQVSQQVEVLGLTTAGMVWPPPRMRFSAPPQFLIVSPRERIERLRTVDLLPDLDTADRDRIEQSLAAEGVSAYITGIGGYGVWPTMVINRYSLAWTAETIAHEWIHNYLAFYPLGWSYLSGGDSIAINETVASIVGRELGHAVLAAYYPEFLPPPETPRSEVAEPSVPSDPPTFDFGREMRSTRLEVDDLLASGQVEAAEAFMEARRETFVANGYNLRVLNQAYFAFHGSYATGPAATDPIGPKLERLRELSPSLRDFLKTVDGLTSVADLDAALAGLE